MRKLFLTAATFCALIVSCTGDKNKGVQTAPAFKQSPLDSAYATIRPAIQTFTIDNKKTNTIKAARGTEILIPAGSLVTADGKPVENAQLEVVEAFSLDEFVTSGLATISNGQLLISNGMAYINAKAGNENLQLKEGASLTVSMPTMSNPAGFQLFTGDGSNWTVDSSMTNIDYMINLPSDLIWKHVYQYYWFGDYRKCVVIDSNIIAFRDKKYENTVIATEEFYARFYTLAFMMERMSYLINPMYYKEFDCADEKFNHDIWKVYFDHPTRSLRESDSVVKSMFVNYFNTNKEKLTAFFKEVNEHARERFGLADSSYYFDIKNNSVEEYFMMPLKWFPLDDYKKLNPYNDHGVNLDAPNAHEQLMAKGLNDKEINDLLKYHFIRKNRIIQLQREYDAMANHDKMQTLYESVFSVKKLGWINCDRFLDDPTAGKAEMFVSATLQNKTDYVDYSLIIPELNVRLSAFMDKSGRYTFTKNAEPYTKLPIGRNAVITAVSMQKDSLYFGSQKIKITDGLTVNLAMKPVTKKSLKDSLLIALRN
jgi:hypothetical protein